MKRLLIAGAILSATACAEAGLTITAVFDGPLTGGIPKGVELYVTADIADLSAYGLGSANNGGGTDGEEFTFPAVSVAAGEYLYVATETDGFAAFFGFAPDYTSGAMSINGDDAIELFHNGVVVDLFGDINVDGSGQPWEYLDGWAARDGALGPSATFDISQWQFSGPNALDDFSDNLAAANSVPVAGASGEPGSEPEPEPAPLQLISAIQGTPDTQGSNRFGDTDVSPLIEQQVQVDAIVVGDFQDGDVDSGRELRGFFLQEESADEDGDPASSEGLFVYDTGFGVDVSLGDRVQVTGTVTQYFGETQLADLSEVVVVASGLLDQVTVADITLPAAATSTAQDGSFQPDLEAYEGMLVRFPGILQVTEQYQLDRFNEIKLVAGERPYQFTQLNTPDSALYQQFQQDLGARRITYDDGLSVQNAAIDQLDGFAPYNEATAVRMGDTVTGLTGVLDYKWAGNSASGATWRVRAHSDGANTFVSTSVRPLAAPGVAGNLSIASLNVLNFFTTLDIGSNTTALGHDPRGADSAEEYQRQLAKTVAAITSLDADLLGLVEIENAFDTVNDGSTAIEVLVSALNTRLGAGVYDYVYPGSSFVGGDAIATALIYKPAVLRIVPGSQPALLDDSVAATLPGFGAHDFEADPVFEGEATNRVPLATSFEHRETLQTFTAVVNHFKSKGPSSLEDEASPNYDVGDGAGFWNARRDTAARALLTWLVSAPTGIDTANTVLLGDLNSYASEDPVQRLLAGGFSSVEPSDAYSYVFDGQIGTLDYILLSAALAPSQAAAATWHINADEADALDYNLDFGRDASWFDPSTPTRNSDHDPLLVGLELALATPAITDLPAALLAEIAEGGIGAAGGPAAQARLGVLQRRLELAASHAEAGRTTAACAVLQQVLKATDGEPAVPDMIAGDEAPLFHLRVQLARESSGC
ncbi:ExeM/NucH family extracellular endonuclease [Parahaliea maris]|uniref:ExeM/NucH family extracellular endonuclease n=1 Tax=Parahaliea maris TaxID=2716870 RepID=A0A5C9A2H3_9GAMM|nr:ExeM/NucH family extracellular endonuclease [Parahaliea maris]TXS94152.1 ExeM/NucH family extracellular endonuclease [Parahaliea maris]